MLTLNDIAVMRIQSLLNQLIEAVKSQNAEIRRLQRKVMKVKNKKW